MKRSESGSASLLTLVFALLLIGVSAIGSIYVASLEARRAEIRKIEALGLVTLERAGGAGALACQMVTANLAITCEFGGDELLLATPSTPRIRVGWRPER